MISTKRKPLSPEAMQALAALPQIGLGAAPQAIPGAEGMSMQSTPLANIPPPDNPAAPISLAPDTAGLTQNIDLGGQGEGGMMGKIMGVLKQPGMSAALLRSAGATLNGGLGAGIAAGTSFMDQRNRDDAAQRMAALEYGLKQRLAANTERATTQTGAYQNGQIALGKSGQLVTMRGQDMTADTTRRGQDVTVRGQDIGASTAIRGQDVSARNTDVSAGTSRANNIDSVNASLYATEAGVGNNMRTNNATMFNRPPSTTTTTKTKPKPATSGFFGYGGTPAVPETTTATTTAQFPRVPARSQLQAGQIYQTANGPARWDGKQFVQ